jgi:cytochrome c oxidase subunit 2
MDTRAITIKSIGLRSAVLVSCLLLVSCRGGVQSAIDPAGHGADEISKLWWLFFYVCTAVFVLVIVALLIAIYKGRRKRVEAAAAAPFVDKVPFEPLEESERRKRNVVAGAVGVTVAILFVFLIASFLTGRAISPSKATQNALMIEVTGYQWWWRVRYVDSNPSNVVVTANEIHIPVGQPVLITLRSSDVIHSFWVPNLMGKKDAIPGKDSSVLLQADRAGFYRGQCAEYCGAQHAHMGLDVIAESPQQFSAWMNAQRSPAVEPSTDSQKRGQQAFLSSPCIMCHTIQGTPANAVTGPNLTHIASRTMIAAATLDNNRGNLSGWVVDSQSIKPGNHMPPNSLNPDDLQALLDYLQSLK